MKRIFVIASAMIGLTVVAWLFAQTPAASPTADLARLVPPGPLLYLEAKDFGALLRDWNGSQEKKLWLAGDNYQVFSRSRLFLKLQKAQAEFAAAAGVPPDMDLLANVAGSQSALAIYDIGNLEFLYITRLGSDKFAGGALWKARGTYQPRQSAGIAYYVKTDQATRRVAAFAAAKDYVVLATREDVMAGALSLIAGQAGSSVAGEAWFANASKEAKQPGELRMAMDFEKLTKSPHFRSYWIQQNITELKQYSSGISDASRAAGEWRENRVLIRGQEIAPDWNEGAVGEIVRFAPASAGLYRAWASPSEDQALELVLQKILSPHANTSVPAKAAPVVNLSDGAVGNEADLEVRIDEPALDTGSQPIAAEVGKLLASVKLDAMMCVGSTRVQPDGVFIGTESGVALLAASNWDATAVRDALTAAVARLLSTDQAGARWQRRGSYDELDGLAPMAVAINGRTLLIANRRELLEAMLASQAPNAAPARYAAVYRHGRELPNFVRMTRLIDAPLAKESSSPDQPEPAFFSGNLASLGQTLARIDSESIAVHDAGATVTQSVVYRLK